MTDRDRLIELINQGDEKCGEMRCVECEHEGTEKCGFNLIADYLLANDVVKVVRCNDCKFSRPRNKSEKNIYFEGVLICESCQMADEPCAVCDDDFCSYGELKELNNNA